MRIDVDFDVDNALSRQQGLIAVAQKRLDLRVLRDSNVYAPEDTNILKDSAIINSKIGEGELVWATPYARAQYYGLPNKSKDRNPRASMKWFEVAKGRYLQDWVKEANDAHNNGD